MATELDEGETWVTEDAADNLANGWDDERPAKQQKLGSDQV
jgi:hypothetical protein